MVNSFFLLLLNQIEGIPAGLFRYRSQMTSVSGKKAEIGP